MARSSKAQNPIGIYVKDGVLRLGFVILYLICIYWSTEAVLKYLDEPAVTNIQYKNGDNEIGITFPLVTICDQIGDQNHEYASIMIEHCGVKMTTEYVFCLPGLGMDIVMMKTTLQNVAMMVVTVAYLSL